jgi:alkanesulfonate monooxygenase SsuD/methylene tetrahydromethanopterin reductase-like flavin-dependent oxidoreductase (luciferase family)
MRYGLTILPEFRWRDAEARWRRAEELGFDHAWTFDHLAWRTLADGPWFGTVPTLTAAALVTERIKLGTFVASPNFRHPVSFVRELLSLDDVSNGRFVLGFGAGGIGVDATVLGNEVLPPGRRVARLAEFLELSDRLLTEDHVDYAGSFYTAVDARTLPGCLSSPRLPFVVAASGPKSMRLVAKYGQGWVTTGPRGEHDDWWQGVADQARQLTTALEEAGREDIDRYLALDSAGRLALESVGYFEDSVGRAEELGFTDVIVHWPRPTEPFKGSEKVLEQLDLQNAGSSTTPP